MIEYRQYNLNDEIKLYTCYNESVGDFYKKLSFAEFDLNFNKHLEFDEKGVFVAWDKEKVIGFIACHVRNIEKNDHKKPGYISTLIVHKNYQRRGIGKTLLKYAEDYLKALGKKKVLIGYTGTLNWPWYIPNTNLHDHNGAPGAKINSDLYFFLLNNGFDVVDEQDAFHLDLVQFAIPKRVVDDLEKLSARGILIELYNPLIHSGINEFYEEIDAEQFERVIRYNLTLDEPKPFAIVSDNGKISGWTGAFYTEPSGRAHFDGIIVAPRMRGLGLGRALFAYLAEYSKTHGSSFMTFFTGRTNFARYIYLGLGFKIIQSFAMMEKEIK